MAIYRTIYTMMAICHFIWNFHMNWLMAIMVQIALCMVMAPEVVHISIRHLYVVCVSVHPHVEPTGHIMAAYIYIYFIHYIAMYRALWSRFFYNLFIWYV